MSDNTRWQWSNRRRIRSTKRWIVRVILQVRVIGLNSIVETTLLLVRKEWSFPDTYPKWQRIRNLLPVIFLAHLILYSMHFWYTWSIFTECLVYQGSLELVDGRKTVTDYWLHNMEEIKFQLRTFTCPGRAKSIISRIVSSFSRLRKGILGSQPTTKSAAIESGELDW